MEKKVILAGSGGQGIMLIGQLLSQAAVLEGQEVTYTQSYGSEMRGGTANCAIIISDEMIGSPIVDKADACIVMDLPSLDLFTPVVSRGGILVINSSLVNRKTDRKNIRCIEIPATQIANQLRNTRGANLVALGAFIEATHMAKPESIIKALKLVLPPHRLDTLSINKQAFQEGRNWVIESQIDERV